MQDLPASKQESIEQIESDILHSAPDSDDEFYDFDTSYVTVSPSEYATPEGGGTPIRIKPRRRHRRRGLQGYQLKISSSRELAGLGPLPREVVSPYPLRRTLPEGPARKRRFIQKVTADEGGPTYATSLTRANATPYILREKSIVSQQNSNVGNTSLGTINPVATPKPTSRHLHRRLSKLPTPKK